jgi:hypothetical protein
MNDEQKKASHDSGDAGTFIEKRKEERYHVSTVYRQYIELRVKAGGAYVPVVPLNFSRHGILFESPVPLNADSSIECLISIPRLLSKDIVFGTRIKHCQKKGNSFIISAAIDTIADATWFNIFMEVHDFIVQRRDTIY